MNNKENFKKAIDQIHATEDLKNKTFNKIVEKQNKSKILILPKFVAVCCTVAICFTIGFIYLKNKPEDNPEKNNIAIVSQENEKLPRFEDMDQLREVLSKKNNNSYIDYYTTDGAILEGEARNEAAKSSPASEDVSISNNDNYSKTNTQEENVDESDIVKTDGKYIYYVTQDKVYIINAKTLDIESKIEEDDDKYYFSPREVYIKNNKLVVLGNGNRFIENHYEIDEDIAYYDVVRPDMVSQAIARVYDIKDVEKPTLYRELSIDGYLTNSRMIGDNLYLISSKSVYYYDGIKDEELLPAFIDTVASKKTNTITCTDIAYFKNPQYNNFLTVAGFDIQKKEKASTETIYGAGDNIYCSQNNLYITQTNFKYMWGTEIEKTEIYKFELDGEKVLLKANGEIKGTVNDQFSMDEYNGNLRIATTKNQYDEKKSESVLYVLDENLNEIGKIDDIGKGEKIYSVRFIGNVGYIVTFKQIDPLFVIDLSDPENPQIKGELKIPGYSSYLHPYDETHIIGIGYNTKSNGYGGTVNDKMKMSMFDVSDLENPKEMFSIDIGNSTTSSEITHNHKALFYNKDKNLIGFPIRTYGYYGSGTSEFVVFEIDLKEGFKSYGKIKEDGYDWEKTIKRAIYIEDTLYVIATDYVVSYDLENLEKQDELKLDGNFSSIRY